MEDGNTREAKLRRLETFRRKLPYLSCSALEQVLNLVPKERCPELHSRKNTKQAVDVTLQDLSSYGQLIEDVEVITISGGRKRIPMINLPTFLQGLFAEGGCFFQLLLDKHNQRPSSFQRPWQGILYADELHPGNQLSSTARKTWCLYFSWLELGTDVLTDEKNGSL